MKSNIAASIFFFIFATFFALVFYVLITSKNVVWDAEVIATMIVLNLIILEFVYVGMLSIFSGIKNRREELNAIRKNIIQNLLMGVSFEKSFRSSIGSLSYWKPKKIKERVEDLRYAFIAGPYRTGGE